MNCPDFTTTELEAETWKAVQGFEGTYSVSNLGRVRRDLGAVAIRYKTERILRAIPNKTGYVPVILTKHQKPHFYLMHRLVAIAFLPNPTNLPCVNHKDGNKAHNRLCNLEWITHSDNNLHAIYALQKIMPGHYHPNAKLTSGDVRQIRAMLRDGIMGIHIAAHFKITPSAVSLIKRRKSWEQLP